jgi:hypothetical protein
MAKEPFKMTVYHQGYFTPDMLSRILGIKPSEAIEELQSRGAKDLLTKGTVHKKNQQISVEIFGAILTDRGFKPTFVEDKEMGMD